MAGVRPVNPILVFIQSLPVHSLIYCGNRPQAIIDAIEPTPLTHASSSDILNATARYDLAIVYDCLEHLTQSEGVTLIGRLRNVIAPKIWILNSTRSQWQWNDFIKLGFKSGDPIEFQQEKLQTYYYDISTYNKKRDWNNPKNWANPENWNKYRW